MKRILQITYKDIRIRSNLKFIMLICLIFISLVIINKICFAISNPAAVYCVEMGYQYRITTTEQGEKGICVIANGIEFDAWDFFRGKIGEKYSYCKKNGYSLYISSDGMNPYSQEYAVCVSPWDGSRTSMIDLMHLNEKLNGSTIQPLEGEPESNDDLAPFFKNAVLPHELNWRNVNNHNWLTPVKDQGYCGSCWAFAAVGATESKIKIARNDPDFNTNLSEQDLVSCSDAGSCIGGWHGEALRSIRDKGIVDESCFVYEAYDLPCLFKCPEAKKRLWHIDDYRLIWSTTGNQREAIKRALTEKGPLAAYINMSGYFDQNGIYRCKYPEWYGHVIVLTGYSDEGNYWIAKNSWGIGFADGGYFKIGYGQCDIDKWRDQYYIDLAYSPFHDIDVDHVDSQLGDIEGGMCDLNQIDLRWMTFLEDCHNGACTGMNIQPEFELDWIRIGSTKPGDESHVSSAPISSIDVIELHSANKESIDLHVWNKNSWEKLGNMHLGWYISKYNLCNSIEDCADYSLDGAVRLKYSSPPSTSNFTGWAMIDSLHLEASFNSDEQIPFDPLTYVNDYRLEQWAVSATASSQWDPWAWGAIQATGAPNTLKCGDYNSAWSPLSSSIDPEFLEVSFETPVYATGINIYETNLGGFVFQVDLIDMNGTYHTIWTGEDTTSCPGVLSLEFPRTEYFVKGARIHTRIDGWEEIDAVRLDGEKW